MCSMHNAIFRGFNSIYQQAPYVADADKSSFIGYCLTWYKVLKFHTENEDKSLFPRTEELLNDDQVWERMHEEHGKCLKTESGRFGFQCWIRAEYEL